MPGIWNWCCCGGGVGGVAISWDDTANKVIRVAEYVSGSWRYEEAATYSTSVINCGVTYAPDGSLHVLYAEFTGSGYNLYWMERTEYGLGYTQRTVSSTVRVGNDVSQATLFAHATGNVTIVYLSGASLPYSLNASVYSGGAWTTYSIAGLIQLGTNATKYGSTIYVYGSASGYIDTMYSYNSGVWSSTAGLAGSGNTLNKCATGLMWADSISVLGSSHATYVRYGLPAGYNSTTQLSYGTAYMKYFVQPFELDDGLIVCAAGIGSSTGASLAQGVDVFDGLSWSTKRHSSAFSNTSLAMLRSRCAQNGTVHSVYANAGEVTYSTTTIDGVGLDITPSAAPYYFGSDYVGASSPRIAVFDSITDGVSV